QPSGTDQLKRCRAGTDRGIGRCRHDAQQGGGQAVGGAHRECALLPARICQTQSGKQEKTARPLTPEADGLRRFHPIAVSDAQSPPWLSTT
nr:hypothetical protein [Tanacetum cinerariifolium]